MNINPVTTQASAAHFWPTSATSQFQSVDRTELPFATLAKELIRDVDVQQQVVVQDVNQLAQGGETNLQAMAANVAKADLSFRFLMEIRDKLISSYQEVMRMQI